MEGETFLLQHPGLPDAHDTGASTWRGRDYITYLQPRTYHLFPKGISIPSSSLAHYSKHCLVLAQHVPVILVPARGARRPCPPPTMPRHSTAVDLWDSFFSHSCKPLLHSLQVWLPCPGHFSWSSAIDKSTEAREEVVIPGSSAHQVQLPCQLVFALVYHALPPSQPSSWKAGAPSSLQVTFGCI